jgi:hypothetical protein
MLAEEPRSYPLIMTLVKRSRLPWRWVLAAVAGVLVLLLVLAAFGDGDSMDLATWGFWRDFLDGPVLVLYILAVYPVLWRRWWRTVRSLQSLLLPDDDGSRGAAAGVPPPKRHHEWVATIIGALSWPLLWQPWERNWTTGELWVNAFDVGTQTILFGLLGWLVYSVFVGSRHIGRLSRLRLNVDVFDTEPLMPIAHSSLGYSLAFIGGISLSLVFQTQEDLLKWSNLIVWVAVVCFAVLLFFLSMWSTHTAMVRLKRHELHMIQQRLRAVSARLNQPGSDSGPDGMGEFSSTMTAWLTYERRIKEAPEWPFNSGIIRKLMASTIAPVAVFLIKVFSRPEISIWP